MGRLDGRAQEACGKAQAVILAGVWTLDVGFGWKNV